MKRSTKADNDKIIDIFARKNGARVHRLCNDSRATGPVRSGVQTITSAPVNSKKPVLKTQNVPPTIKQNTLNYVIQQEAEIKERRFNANPRASSVYSLDSIVSQTSSISTVNCNGDQFQFNPLRLLQFLFLELKAEVKEFLPKDNYKCKKILQDMAHTLKRISYSDINIPNKNSKNNLQPLKNQFAQTEDNWEPVSKIYKEIQSQTDLNAKQLKQLEVLQNEQQHLKDVAAENLAIQVKLDADCRFLSKTCDEMRLEKQKVTDELTESQQENSQLRTEISFLQDKLKNTINDEKLDDKCKELRSDIQNLQQLIEMQKLEKSDNLIDNLNQKLVESNDKIMGLEGQCAKSKYLMYVKELENAKLDILLKSRNSQISDIRQDLYNIHSVVHDDISNIKQNFLSKSSKSSSMYSITPSSFSTKTICQKNSQSSYNEGSKKSDADMKVMEDFIEKKKQMLAHEFDTMTSLKGNTEATTQKFPVVSNSRLSAMNSESANHRSNSTVFNYQEFHDVLENVTLPPSPEQFSPLFNFPQHMTEHFDKEQ